MARMTPLEFAQRYWALDTFVFEQSLGGVVSAYVPPQGWHRLRVDNYRLGASQWDEKFWNENIAAHFRGPVDVRVRTIWGDVIDHTFVTATSARRHFHMPFVGKGTPEQAQIAIQLVYRFRPVSTTLEQFVERDFIGLDCNGFVGNYIQRVIQGKDWLAADNNLDPGPTTLIGDLVRGQGKIVSSLDEIVPEGIYLFGWCHDDGTIRDPSRDRPTDYGHIMMTEPGTLQRTDAGWSIGVIEATAADEGKLRYLQYMLPQDVKKSTGGSIFRVRRGPGGAEMNVRISRLNF